MTDTYEFLKAQKDAILAKREAEESEWIDAAWKDIQYYRNRIKELEAQLSNQSSGNSRELNNDAADARRYRWLRDEAAYVGVNVRHGTCLWVLRGVYERGNFDESVDAAIKQGGGV